MRDPTLPGSRGVDDDLRRLHGEPDRPALGPPELGHGRRGPPLSPPPLASPCHTLRGVPSGRSRWRATARGWITANTSPSIGSATATRVPSGRVTDPAEARPRKRFTPTRSAT